MASPARRHSLTPDALSEDDLAHIDYMGRLLTTDEVDLGNEATAIPVLIRAGFVSADINRLLDHAIDKARALVARGENLDRFFSALGPAACFVLAWFLTVIFAPDHAMAADAACAVLTPEGQTAFGRLLHIIGWVGGIWLAFSFLTAGVWALIGWRSRSAKSCDEDQFWGV